MSINLATIPNIITYDYEEIHGFRQGGGTPDHWSGRRMLQCAWEDRWYLYKQLLGTTIASGTTLVYRLPQQFPGVAHAYVNYIEVTPFGAPISSSNNTVLQYEKARLLVHYETAVYEAQPHEVLIEEHLEPSVEFLTLPNTELYWDSGQAEQLHASEAPGIPIKMIDWVYTLHFIPLLQAEILSLTGHCNSVAIYSHTLDLWFEIGTLLYSYPTLSRQTTTGGTKSWDITLRFTWREKGWNKFPKRGEGITFQTVYDKYGDVLEPFPLADLGVLLL